MFFNKWSDKNEGSSEDKQKKEGKDAFEMLSNLTMKERMIFFVGVCSVVKLILWAIKNLGLEKTLEELRSTKVDENMLDKNGIAPDKETFDGMIEFLKIAKILGFDGGHK